MTALPFFNDAELQALCDGLEQPAAQVRYLQRLGLKVERKPNGRPLLMRSELERVLGAGRHTPANDARGESTPAPGAPNRAALLQVITGGRRGAKAQGR